jgi:hypothetical protein
MFSCEVFAVAFVLLIGMYECYICFEMSTGKFLSFSFSQYVRVYTLVSCKLFVKPELLHW